MQIRELLELSPMTKLCPLHVADHVLQLSIMTRADMQCCQVVNSSTTVYS